MIDLLAAELGVTPNARRMWRARGHVPPRWHLLLLQAAQKRGIEINPRDLLAPIQQKRRA